MTLSHGLTPVLCVDLKHKSELQSVVMCNSLKFNFHMAFVTRCAFVHMCKKFLNFCFEVMRHPCDYSVMKRDFYSKICCVSGHSHPKLAFKGPVLCIFILSIFSP